MGYSGYFRDPALDTAGLVPTGTVESTSIYAAHNQKEMIASDQVHTMILVQQFETPLEAVSAVGFSYGGSNVF